MSRVQTLPRFVRSNNFWLLVPRQPWFDVRALTVLFLVCLTGIPQLAAQDDATRRSELGLRQKLVEKKMLELENKFTVIAEKLREKEPERANRLIAAYQESKERLITRQMDQIAKLLDLGQLQLADQQLDEVIGNLEYLVKLLTNQKSEKISTQEEIDMLQRWKDNIQQQIGEQHKHQRETENIANKDQAVHDLEARIKELEGLIDKQRDVIEDTNKNSDAGLRELDKIADKQFEVRKSTQNLIKKIGGTPGEGEANPPSDGKPSDGKPSDGKPSDGKPSDGKPSDGKPSDGKPSDGKPSDGKPSDGKPSDGKPSDGKPSDGKPSDGKPSDGKPSDGKPSDGKPSGDQSSEQQSQPPKPGQQALEKATEHQRRAEEKLGSGNAEDANKHEQDALDEMDNALTELKKEKRRIESLPPEALKRLADQQRRTRDKALDIIKEMKKAPSSKDDKGPNSSQSPQAPGQKGMESASESMEQAADDMQEQNADDAQEHQQQANQDMQQALDEIEERLNQLRDETREEKLARLESRFREMLERQKIASIITVELNDKRVNLGDLHRRDQLLLLRMANEETEISEVAQQAYDLLLEDGTSIVFPEIVQELRVDLGNAAQLLHNERTDRFTQLVQQEIETTIEDLLDALKKAKKDGESSGSGGGGGGGGGDQPLLKMSAELKILRMQQMRLNRRTKKVNQLRGEPDLDPLLDQEAVQAADLQSKLIEMTEGIMDKMGQ